LRVRKLSHEEQRRKMEDTPVQRGVAQGEKYNNLKPVFFLFFFTGRSERHPEVFPSPPFFFLQHAEYRQGLRPRFFSLLFSFPLAEIVCGRRAIAG